LKKKERAGNREKLYEKGRDSNEMDVTQELGDREVKRELREMLGKLGEPCRKILMLFYYENLPMKEIVQHLHYDNEQVVRNKKYKCLKELTELVKANPLIAGQINELIK
jgi:DNA-directed RNA polymerase specialized sigma24 family protein